MITEIINIPIEKLHPHPHNPRRELGDLTELADSIKAQGILQNLTVVPWFSTITGQGADCPKQQEEMGYIVVIGHRRHAAAELAGLAEVPCMISDMDERTQISTMLLENLQREDLTVYEQAQGFQMMLDLGDTVGSIAERTGFSQSTIRRRMHLLELDQDKFRDADARGATLSDFAELEKIKDAKRKNEVLGKIGTSDFKMALRKAIDEEKAEVQRTIWREALSAFATEVESGVGYRQRRYLNLHHDVPENLRPDDADTVEYFFEISKWGDVYLYAEEVAQEKQSDPEEEARKKQLEERKEGLNRLRGNAFHLRKDFVQGVGKQKIMSVFSEVVALAAWNALDFYRFDSTMFLELINYPADELEFTVLKNAIEKNVEFAFLAMSYCMSGDGENKGFYWQAQHEANEDLSLLYALLEKLGYGMSEDEKALQDGTHELFAEKKKCSVCGCTDGEACEGGCYWYSHNLCSACVDPCELCRKPRSSHCDDCCAACSDHCNAQQVCRMTKGES